MPGPQRPRRASSQREGAAPRRRPARPGPARARGAVRFATPQAFCCGRSATAATHGRGDRRFRSGEEQLERAARAAGEQVAGPGGDPARSDTFGQRRRLAGLPCGRSRSPRRTGGRAPRGRGRCCPRRVRGPPSRGRGPFAVRGELPVLEGDGLPRPRLAARAVRAGGPPVKDDGRGAPVFPQARRVPGPAQDVKADRQRADDAVDRSFGGEQGQRQVDQGQGVTGEALVDEQRPVDDVGAALAGSTPNGSPYGDCVAGFPLGRSCATRAPRSSSPICPCARTAGDACPLPVSAALSPAGRRGSRRTSSARRRPADGGGAGHCPVARAGGTPGRSQAPQSPPGTAVCAPVPRPRDEQRRRADNARRQQPSRDDRPGDGQAPVVDGLRRPRHPGRPGGARACPRARPSRGSARPSRCRHTSSPPGRPPASRPLRHRPSCRSRRRRERLPGRRPRTPRCRPSRSRLPGAARRSRGCRPPPPGPPTRAAAPRARRGARPPPAGP